MKFSLEMKKLLCLALPRITTMEVRIITDRERYLAVLDKLESLQRTLEGEIRAEQDKCPDCDMPNCICVDDDVERLRSLDGSSPYERGKSFGRAHALIDSEMVAEHSRIAAYECNVGPAGVDREQFMEGYGYGFSEKKEEQEKIIKAMEDHPFRD